MKRSRQMIDLYGNEEQIGYDYLQETMRQSLRLQEQYAQEMKILTNAKIVPLYKTLYPNCQLTTIKGIGIQSAAIYRAFIQDINRFANVKKFRSWCGIVPRSKQSGNQESKGLPLTKAGPNLIKATLYCNSEVARQWDVQIAKVYYTQMVDYGKHHTQAICACASHIASRVYTVLKEQRPYELRDLQGKPITDQESKKLCLQYRVSQEVRNRNNKRFRKNRKDHKVEVRMQRQEQQIK